MIVNGGIHADIELQAGDYFFVASDEGNTLKIVVSDKKRRPLNLRKINRSSAVSLILQLNKMMLLQDQARAEVYVSESVDDDGESVFDDLKELLAED